jgi:hypothetical protein
MPALNGLSHVGLVILVMRHCTGDAGGGCFRNVLKWLSVMEENVGLLVMKVCILQYEVQNALNSRTSMPMVLMISSA